MTGAGGTGGLGASGAAAGPLDGGVETGAGLGAVVTAGWVAIEGCPEVDTVEPVLAEDCNSWSIRSAMCGPES